MQLTLQLVHFVPGLAQLTRGAVGLTIDGNKPTD
jgi:hypothetical protein